MIDSTHSSSTLVSPNPASSVIEAPVVPEIPASPTQPYRLAGRQGHPDDTTVAARPEGGVCFRCGGGYFGVIAGPCTVESEEQIVETARAVRAAGATALRGGAYKPRTSPYSFQGLKEDGLKMLALARSETGLAVVTEVTCVTQLDVVARYADVLQIGSRNMQNYALLEAVGKQSNPVLLKRGLCATLDEFLLAAEYILAQGNESVILCERGVRTFEEDTRFTLALTSVPVLQRKSHLPVIVDPSHSAGKDYLIAPMCNASLAAGADGLIVEVHPNPSQAKVDGEQSIHHIVFTSIMDGLKKLAPVVGKKMAE